MSCSFDSDRPRRLLGSATASATSAEPLPLVPALRLLDAAARPPRFATARPPEPPRTLPLFAIMPFPTSHSPYRCAYRSYDSRSRLAWGGQPTYQGVAARDENAPLIRTSSNGRAEPCPG